MNNFSNWDKLKSLLLHIGWVLIAVLCTAISVGLFVVYWKHFHVASESWGSVIYIICLSLMFLGYSDWVFSNKDDN